MKLSDFKGALHTFEARVESVENPYGDYYVIKLKADTSIDWVPGEHGIFKLPGKDIEGKKWRAFSIASVSKEGFIMIGTRTGKETSSFKKALISMTKGEKVSVRGPFGWFKLQDTRSPIVFFAQGVGITPIRALLKSLEADKRPLNLVYASSEYYLFEEDLDEIAKVNKNLVIHKTTSAEETTAKLLDLAKTYGNEAYYYNSGAPAAITSIKSKLKDGGVKSKRMIDDTFIGY